MEDLARLADQNGAGSSPRDRAGEHLLVTGRPHHLPLRRGRSRPWRRRLLGSLLRLLHSLLGGGLLRRRPLGGRCLRHGPLRGGLLGDGLLRGGSLENHGPGVSRLRKRHGKDAGPDHAAGVARQRLIEVPTALWCSGDRAPAGRRTGRAAQVLTASLNDLPAFTRGTVAAGIWISAPVPGLRPVRAFRSVRSKVKNPGS